MANRASYYTREEDGSLAPFIDGVYSELAWAMATSGDRAPDDLDVSLRAARQAAALSNHLDAGILDTLARVHHELGNSELALKWQQDAVELAEDADLRAELEQTLVRYGAAGKPPGD